MEDSLSKEKSVIKKSSSWSITCERYVAYFDIMGFKAMIAKDKGTTELYNGFKKLIDGITKRLYKYTRIKISVFSDLIVIITKDNDSKSFAQLADASLMLIQDVLKNEHWGLNGCISAGIVSYDENRNIFLGQPIVDAYLTTEDIEFYGVVIHTTAEQAVKEYIEVKCKEGNNSHLEKLFVEQRIHFKSGFYSQFHLRWFDFDVVKMYNPGDSNPIYTKLLDEIKQKTHGRGRRYIEYTIDAINYDQQIRDKQ